MIALQEELDWEVYRLYGLIDEDLTLPETEVPPLGSASVRSRSCSRAGLPRARSRRRGLSATARHRSRSCRRTGPSAYRELVERRIELIESDRNIGLIERPEYKRRWQWEPWEAAGAAALRSWLLDRLESDRFWSGEPTLISLCAARRSRTAGSGVRAGRRAVRRRC